MFTFKKKKIEVPDLVPVHQCPAPDLENLYNENKDFFQEMLVREFVGYVPKEINEPVLKFYADHAPMIQKWLLWQSHFINRKAMHDPLKLPRYEGMMVVYTVLFKLASASTNIIPSEKPPVKENEPDQPLIEKELETLAGFKEGFKPKPREE